MSYVDADTIGKAVEKAEAILGYRFKDRALLARALTHPSAAEEHVLQDSYERLEFLGDSYLGTIIAHELFHRFDDIDEGGLTRIKVSLVSGESLSSVADELGLGDCIIFGGSEQGTGNRGLHSALENVYESLVAALLLDGGLEVAREWVLKTLGPHISKKRAETPENPKSSLQELYQEKGITPVYRLIREEGPPHDRTFFSEVIAGDGVIGTGSGRSKKESEVNAALDALAVLEEQG